MINMDSYDREQAVAYAIRWALDRNPAFYDYEKLGGDCTNFISQVLLNGGAPMDYKETFGWYYLTANRKSPSWTAVEPLYRYLIQPKKRGLFAVPATRESVILGDVIQLSFDGVTFRHTTVITEKREGELYVCAHSFDSKNRPISSYSYKKLRFLRIKVEK